MYIGKPLKEAEPFLIQHCVTNFKMCYLLSCNSFHTHHRFLNAVEDGKLELVKTTVQAVNINKVYKVYQGFSGLNTITPLCIACAKGYFDIVEYLTQLGAKQTIG